MMKAHQDFLLIRTSTLEEKSYSVKGNKPKQPKTTKTNKEINKQIFSKCN